jgi:hypothetical protein
MADAVADVIRQFFIIEISHNKGDAAFARSIRRCDVNVEC